MTVTVYSKANCVQCTQTKKAFTREGVNYQEIMIDQDPEALNYVKSLGYLSAPVVITDEESWSGFRPDLIKKTSKIALVMA